MRTNSLLCISIKQARHLASLNEALCIKNFELRRGGIG